MIPIDANTVAAESANDLRDAVNMSAVNYIYLANNITLTGGITIPATKASLVFDGEYPLNSGNRNELTDVDSSSYLDTLGIGSTSSIALTFRNMVINGRNYYGVPYIVETIAGITNTDNVSVTYENVRYTGAQMTYNCNGLTRYINCDITIQRIGSLPSEEVGEVNRVELGGRTTILHRSISSGDDFAVFYFRGTTATMALTVLADAQVDITTENCYFMYNVDPLWGTVYPVPYVVQPRASLNLTVNKGISYSASCQLSSFLVDENASFRYIQTANNGTTASVYVNGALTVRQGAQFYMQAQNSAEPLIRFTNGTGRSLNVSDPLSFVLYCANDAALVSAGTTQVSLQGGQLNTWSVPVVPVQSAGGFSDTPENKWRKLNYATPVIFSGSFTQTATSVTGNLQAEDMPYPPVTNLHLHEARVISIGDWPVAVDSIQDDGRPVTGSTEPGANMRIIYNAGGTTHTIDGVAGPDGSFSISTAGETPANIPAGTVVAVWSNIPFLIKETTATAIEAGDLLITSAPVLIVYTVPAISTNPTILPRANPGVPVVIEDTRAEGSGWELFASITGPLQTALGDILPDAVIFLENAGGTPVTLDATPVVVRTGTGSTDVVWSREEGILVRVTRPVQAGVRYSTHVIWEIRASGE